MPVELPPELTLESAVLMAIEAGLSQVWTALPGRVTSYDASTQRATVQPTVANVDPDRALPSVPNVPVSFPRAGGYLLALPIEVGDTGLLVFTALSAQSWLKSGSEGAPQDTRRHTLSSAVFLPGVSPTAVAGYPTEGVTIGKETNLTSIHPVAMADRVNAFITALDNAIQAGLAAPTPPAQFAAFASAWNTVKPSLNLDTGSTDVSVTSDVFP